VTNGSLIDKVYIALELMDHDLKSFMENNGQKYFTVGEVKNIMIQLLSGILYLHDNHVLHRDIKTSNILYNNNGEIKLCDFGISRHFCKSNRCYTPIVVTPYYRSPELFLGEDKYSTEVDLWSIGCIMGELFTKKPMFTGDGKSEILYQIFSTIGNPTEDKWPGWTELQNFKTFKFSSDTKCKLRSIYPKHHFDSRPAVSNCGIDLFERLLCLSPKNRINAPEALQHPYFQEKPYPKPNCYMPNLLSTALLDFKLRNKVRHADPLERAALLLS
jgi:cell division cycle 2-like protein